MTRDVGEVAKPEVAPRPETNAELILLSREMYPEDSLGHTYFPEILEGRWRPEHFADIHINVGRKTTKELNARGIATLSDIFHLSEASFAALPKRYQNSVNNRLDYYLNELEVKQMLTPHARFLYVATGKEQGPIEPRDEPEFVRSVNEALENQDLSERDKHFLRLRFGLVDWKPRALEETGRALGATKERIRFIEANTLAKLRHRKRRQDFMDYSTLPREAIGRLIGYTYRKDIPALPIRLDDLVDSSGEILNASRMDWAGANDFEELLVSRFSEKASEATRADVIKQIMRMVREHEPHQVFRDLLPEVSVPYGVTGTGVARNMSIRDLNFTMRTQIELERLDYGTLGSILNVTRNEQGEVVPFSPEAAGEIGRKALKLLLYFDVIAKEANLAVEPEKSSQTEPTSL